MPKRCRQGKWGGRLFYFTGGDIMKKIIVLITALVLCITCVICITCVNGYALRFDDDDTYIVYPIRSSVLTYGTYSGPTVSPYTYRGYSVTYPITGFVITTPYSPYYPTLQRQYIFQETNYWLNRQRRGY